MYLLCIYNKSIIFVAEIKTTNKNNKEIIIWKQEKT